jgi:hypothetical protein
MRAIPPFLLVSTTNRMQHYKIMKMIIWTFHAYYIIGATKIIFCSAWLKIDVSLYETTTLPM